MEQPVSASLATETAQHERSKTSKPFIFNKTTIQSRSYLRGFSNRYAQNATAHVPELQEYQTNPSTAHDKQLWDSKQRS